MHWRKSLQTFLDWFQEKQACTRLFRMKIFLFFILINFACFWWALATAYPQHIVSHKADEYFFMSFPVAFLGALFDILSLAVTLYIIRQALASASNARYMALLSVDLLIAVLATFWVLMAFVVSGWLVSFVLERPETLTSRTVLYEGRFWNALLNPFSAENMKNIYFGIIMGASALLPTLFHALLAGRAAVASVFTRNMRQK